MAKSQKDLKGWQYALGDEPFSKLESVGEGTDSPSRRSRRRLPLAAQKITLRNVEEDFSVKEGDTLLVQQEGNTPEIALVKEIRLGNDSFLDIVVAWFIRMRDIEFEDLPPVEPYRDRDQLNENELFITAYLDEIKVSEIVSCVKVLSSREFAEIVLDDSNKADTFVCRRGTDSAGENFTDKFDFKRWMESFKTDNNEFIDFIRNNTVPLAYKVSSKSREPLSTPGRKKSEEATGSIETKTTKVQKKHNLKSKRIFSSNSVKEETKLDGNNEVPDSSPPENDSLDSSDDEIEQDVPKTPTKRKRKGTQRLRLYANDKLDEESKKFITSMIHPLNKRLKIKEASKPSILSLSPKKPRFNSQSSALGLDASTEAFKELKAKLHTSAKISSLPCREDEFTSVYLNLETAIQEEAGCCIYVSGTPGVGKTATIREVISQLKDLAHMGDLKDFDYLEINGLKLLTPNVAYEVLWEKICGIKVSASNAALLLENYFSQNTEKKPLVVLMDELDQIVTKKQNVMYNFFNWPTYNHSKLIVVAVANTMDLPERVLSNKISSRLGLRRIQFIGYTFEQLGVIIKHRLEMLSLHNRRKVILNEDAVGFASRKVASVSGDARRALTICRRAVEIAEAEFLESTEQKEDEQQEEQNTFIVKISHISRAINETVNSPISQFLASLSFACKLFLVGVLLRMKRSGLAENALGEIIDEIKNSSAMLSSNEGLKLLDAVDANIGLLDFLYKGGLILKPGPPESRQHNIRILFFKDIVNELVETGILMQKAIKGERHRLITLNVSEEEVIAVLKRDKVISEMLGSL